MITEICILRCAWIDLTGYWLTDIDMQDELHGEFDNDISGVMIWCCAWLSCIAEYVFWYLVMHGNGITGLSDY